MCYIASFRMIAKPRRANGLRPAPENEGLAAPCSPALLRRYFRVVSITISAPDATSSIRNQARTPYPADESPDRRTPRQCVGRQGGRG